MSSDAGIAFTVVGTVALVIVAAIANRNAPKNCDICGGRIVNKYHVWDMADGTKQSLCPHCNSNMKRRKGAAAVKKKLSGSQHA